MAELLILWGYIGIVNSCIGAGVLKGIGLLTGRKKIVYGLAGTELAGIVAITVYAQTVSIFGKVFMAAHLILLAAAGVMWFTAVPAGGALAANDIRAWMTVLQQNLGPTACGQINCVGPMCTVTVRWDDSRGSGGSVTQTFSTTSRI